MTARAITLHQPWASLVAEHLKWIETRSWPVPKAMIGQRLIVHAGKARPLGDATPSLAVIHASCEAFGGDWPWLAMDGLPLGAVVASCVLRDCVPTNPSGPLNWSAADHDAGWWPGEGRNVWVGDDQLAFGDFSPGRYAWLLEDVKATSERCPRCWGGKRQPDDRPGSRRGLHGHLQDWMDCPTCEGRGVCSPVPMRGHQGLWTPTWEAA